VERILDRIGNETNDSERKFENYFIGNRIRNANDDFNKTLIAICDGSITEYKELKRGLIEDYIIKLDNYVSKIELLNKK
jgi:hypothetical protein